MAGKQFRGEYVHRMPDGVSVKGENANGEGQEKKKTTKKQGRFAPGKGYRPDRKAARKKSGGPSF
jgi:hypothetical protein